MTRPSISFSVSVVSQFVKPGCSGSDLEICKGCPGIGMVKENRGHPDIFAYIDADWAGSSSDRRSTSGYCVLIGEPQLMDSGLCAETEY